MSRFILNLRLLDTHDPALDVSFAASGLLPTLSLRSHSGWPGQSGGERTSTLPVVLANIGAPLDFDGKPEDEDEPEAFLHECYGDNYK